MTSANATIGVLGGMGPEATILFMQKMLDAVPAQDDCDHVPLIVHNNTQVPSRIGALIEGSGADPGPVLAEMAKSLEAMGAKALAMPCNTAHRYAGAIAGAVSIPFLCMVQLAAGKALELTAAGARVGVLGSPALPAAGVFDGPLTDAGLTPVYGEDTEAHLEIIRAIKKNGVSTKTAVGLQRASDHLVDLGADVIMVCCTEFSLLADRLRTEVPLFDTIDSLVETCVAFSTGKPPFSGVARRSSAASVPLQTDQLGKETLQC